MTDHDSEENTSDSSLSDIDKSDFTHLEFEIQGLPIGHCEKDSVDQDEDIASIDPIQLWKNAYAP